MRRAALPILITACVIVAAVLAWLVVERVMRPGPSDDEDGGPVVTEVRTPGAFTRIDLSGLASVELVQGDRHEVVVESPAGRQDRVRTRVEGGTLVVSTGGTRGDWRLFGGAGRQTSRIVITAPAIEAITVSGAVKIAARALEVPSLRISASGATAIRIESLTAETLRFSGSGAVKADLAGKVSDQAISLSGAGSVRAPNLASESAKVSVTGAGHVIVNAAKDLRVSLSGAGSVEYLGNPELRQSVSGVGRVKRIEPRAGPAPTRFHIAAL
ncbi:hypothetical protein BURK1_01346 [Burkholderiales bacterium]|nr:hypothetical protein BURK1_01346 [Burkholderiales bacterium]